MIIMKGEKNDAFSSASVVEMHLKRWARRVCSAQKYACCASECRIIEVAN